MYKRKKIAVVVPAYNEERLIGKVIETIPDYIDYIVVVDDASSDDTLTTLEKHRKELGEKMLIIKHEKNEGVGASIASGYVWCRDQGVDVAVVMAGDAQMDPKDLPNLLKPIVENKADYSKGNRLFTGDAWQKIPKIRYLGNSMLSLLTKIASGYWQVADSQCGYTAINKKALGKIDWDGMHKCYGQPNDLLVRLNIENMRVYDVEVEPVYGIGEKSGIKPLFIIPKMFLLLSRLFMYRMVHKYVIRDFHPLIFFYSLGGIFFLSSLFLSVRMFWLWYIQGAIPPTTLILNVFSMMSMFQFTLFAMWFDMENNRHLSNSQKL
ncbi:MAG TPA: glycosyltransferase family 2 protein [Anaerolineae bacterium]|nr:glycosyltransferase family 2 protein [Anaerolineae bacterium]